MSVLQIPILRHWQRPFEFQIRTSDNSSSSLRPVEVADLGVGGNPGSESKGVSVSNDDTG